jgi:hypothetical protein
MTFTGASVITFEHSRITNDCLHRLQSEVVDFANRLPISRNEPPVQASDWAKLFVSLGQELKRRGMARQLIDVTIGVPADNVAIDVLRLACTADSTNADPVAFQNLAARLEVVLSVDLKEKGRFVASLKNVMQRLTMFHC